MFEKEDGINPQINEAYLKNIANPEIKNMHKELQNLNMEITPWNL